MVFGSHVSACYEELGTLVNLMSPVALVAAVAVVVAAVAMVVAVVIAVVAVGCYYDCVHASEFGRHRFGASLLWVRVALSLACIASTPYVSGI